MTQSLLNTLVNVVLFVGLPLLIYGIVQRRRHDRSFRELMQRTGLVVGDRRYIGYCVLASVGVVTAVLLWPPSVTSSTAEGSAFREFAGMGLTGTTVLLALLYGVVKTGFSEEFLFRGMLAGSLARRMSLPAANVVQAFVFLIPHGFILLVAPDMWPVLPVVFAGALFGGWVRIRSGSILGPWLLHAVANVTMALSVAIRSA